MQLWQECYGFVENRRTISFWYKFKSIIIYGISDWNFYKNDIHKIINLLQSRFYKAKRTELIKDIASLEHELQSSNATEKITQLTKKVNEIPKKQTV